MKLALEILDGDPEISHRHVRRAMSEQLHQGRKGHTGTKHLGGICVSKLVRHDASMDTGGGDYLAQLPTQFAHQGFFSVGTG